VDYSLEELARETLEEADLGAPVDPDVLAHELGVAVQDGGPGCQGLCIPGERAVVVDDSLRPTRRAFALAHELAHLLLVTHGFPNTEANANYLGSALLLPRDDFTRDLRRFGWDLLLLQSRHRLASMEALMRRVVALRPETRGWVFDRPLLAGRRPSKYSVPWGLRLSHLERTAAAEAGASGAPVQVVAGVEAWPVFEHHWKRVVVLADLESLEAHL